jgi:hypothetical protein
MRRSNRESYSDIMDMQNHEGLLRAIDFKR